MKNKRLDGFTVVELIITITIVAIFLALSFVSLDSSQISSRDSERKSDVETIAKNLESFYTSGSSNEYTCPNGFIAVPGSSTYGTSNFCVMKYEAKESDDGKAVSIANDAPWTDISQANAATAATNACSGCHLITEAEWMTIAQNVLLQSRNWSMGAVGSGFIYNGYVNGGSYNISALAADSNDSNPTAGMSSVGNTVSTNSSRVLYLSDGEAIWDLSGNAWEWTAGQIVGSQLGVSTDTGFAWHEWNVVSQNGFPINSMPSSTGVSGMSSWPTPSSYGIGQVISYYSATGTHLYIRGGGMLNGSQAGVLSLGLAFVPGQTDSLIGFRVTYSVSGKKLVLSATGRYPSTELISANASDITNILQDLDTGSLSAPNQSSVSLIAAANSSTSQQPTINQYIYQPLQSDGSLCTSSTQNCTKFNIYYQTEADSTVHKITSDHQ